MLVEDSGEGKGKKKKKSQGSAVIKRMVDSYRKRKRMKKLQKLADDPQHWKGLS